MAQDTIMPLIRSISVVSLNATGAYLIFYVWTDGV